MLSRTLIQAGRRAAQAERASSSLSSSTGAVRHASQLPIPPKIATPNSVAGTSASGGSSSRMENVVDFYKSLPKGAVTPKKGGGLKNRYFNGENASGTPIIWLIGSLLLLGYSLEYQHLKHHKNYEH